MLTHYLCQHYDATHPAVVYEAAEYPIFDPGIEQIPLARQPEAQISPISTLYIAPQTQAPLDDEMLERLGFDFQLLNGTHR